MATSSRILTWKIPWTEEPGRPQPMKSRMWLSTHTHTQTPPLITRFDLLTVVMPDVNIWGRWVKGVWKLLFGNFSDIWNYFKMKAKNVLKILASSKHFRQGFCCKKNILIHLFVFCCFLTSQMVFLFSICILYKQWLCTLFSRQTLNTGIVSSN